MMMSIVIPVYYLGYSPGLGSVRATNTLRRNLPTGFSRVRAMCKPERDVDTIKELADGSLMFSFGSSHPSGHTRASHPSGNTKRANKFSSPHAEQITSSKNSFPRRMPSNFKRRSPIPISIDKKGNSIRNSNPRQADTGSEIVQDNFASEKASGKIHNANHSKRGYQLSQRSSPSYVKGSSISSPKDGDSPRQNKLSVLFKQAVSTINKKNPTNNEKIGSRFPKFKFKKHEHPAKIVWWQYHEKNKDEFKEDASIRQSSVGDEKVPARIPSSRRGPRKSKYEKAIKIVDESLSEAFLLSRPPSKFVRRSPIPLSAIKQDVRPVPGIKESKFSYAESASTERDEAVSRDSDGTPTSSEIDLILGDSSCLSAGKLNYSSGLKSEELEKDGGILRDLDGTSTYVENGSVRRDSPSSSKDKLNDLSELKLTELKKTAKSYGLKGYSKLKKAELLELLRNAVRQVHE